MPWTDASEVNALLTAIAAKIRTIDIFGTGTALEVPVFVKTAGNLGIQIAAALAGGIGVLAIVAPGKINRPRTQSLRNVYDPLQFFVRVAENAFLNKNRPHVLELAERINAELAVDWTTGSARPWTPAVTGASQIFPHEEMEPLHIVSRPGAEADPKENFDGWDIPFITKFAPEPSRDPSP